MLVLREQKGWDDYMKANNSHEQAVQEIPQTGFFGHPRGLGVLFFVEF